MGPLETCSDQAMKTIFDVNLFGAVRTIQAFLPAMKRRRAGRIIVSSSIGGLQGGTPGTLAHGEPRGRDSVLRVRLCPRAALQLRVLRQQVCSRGAVRELGHRPAALQHPVSTAGNRAAARRAPRCRDVGMLGRGDAHTWLGAAPSCSLTLVECGPVNTSFLANLQRPDPEGSELQHLDAETRGLYRRYLQHCQSLFRETAQEVEEVLQVGWGLGEGSTPGGGCGDVLGTGLTPLRCQVFLEAISTPCPPLRCVTTQLFAPLSRLRLANPDGSAYVRAMHDFVFGHGGAGGAQP